MTIMDKDYDILFRIMILGDTGVGKTCLLQRFCEEEFRHSHVCTIGIDFKMKTVVVDDIRVRVQIWDTAGQERYRTITRQYYRKAQGVILTYDITNENSFLNIRKWASDVSEFGDERVQTILVGNKSDREDGRAVTFEQGSSVARDYGMPFFETSAYTDSNVTDVFKEIAKRVLIIHKDDMKTPDIVFSSSDENDLSEDEGIVRDMNGIMNNDKSDRNVDTQEGGCCIIL